jgi:tetratricopeptide (TPR) repeat protein
MPGMGSTRYRTAWLCLATVALTACGCTTTLGRKKGERSFADKLADSFKSTFNHNYHDDQADAKLAEAEELFAQENYVEAQSRYGNLADNTYNAAQLCEKARFREAECCRMQKHLPRAVETYNKYLQDFPGGVYSKTCAERMFAIAELWLKDTLGEIEADEKSKSFVKMPQLPNPFDTTRPTLDGEGVLVKTMENIAIGAPNADCAEKAMFWAGYLHYIRGRYEDSDHHFSTLVEMYKDSPLRQEAARLAIDSKNRSTGGAPYDVQKSNEALQLVNNLEATEPQFRVNGEKSEWITKQKLGIRESQAEKDFETAEYYRRTNRFGSAYFYYELVKRSYPGTKHSDLATSRIDEMKQVQAQRAADKAAGKTAPLEKLQENVDKLVGKAPKVGEGGLSNLGVRPAAPVVPANGNDIR